MRDCEFTSNKFKDDVANLKNNPTRLTGNPQIKINLLKEIDKEKSRNDQLKLNLRTDIEHDEKEFQAEYEKLTSVRAKLGELKTADEVNKNKLQKELVELIDSLSIKEAAKKAGLLKSE